MLPPAIENYFSSLPAVTRAVLATIVVLTVMAWLLHRDWCFAPRWDLSSFNVDFLVAPLVHRDVLHLLMNGWAWIVEGSAVERSMGSAPLAFLVAAFTVLTQLTQMALQPARLLLGGRPYCGLGFSGVLFGLLTVNCIGEQPDAVPLLFGCIPVQSRLLPLALLALCELLFPTSALVAHASGVALGYAVVKFVPRERIAAGFGLSAPVDSFAAPKISRWIIFQAHPWSDANSAVLPARPVVMPLGSAFPAPGAVAVPSGWRAFAGSGRTLGSTTPGSAAHTETSPNGGARPSADAVQVV